MHSWDQLKIMLWRNYLLFRRTKVQTSFLFIWPLLPGVQLLMAEYLMPEALSQPHGVHSLPRTSDLSNLAANFSSPSPDEDKVFHELMKNMFPMQILYIFLHFFNVLITFVVDEKEQGRKEMLLLNGVSNCVNRTSLAIVFTVIMIIPIVIVSIIVTFGYSSWHSNLSIIVLFLLLSFSSQMSVGLLLTALFDRANLGSQVGTSIYIIPSLIYNAMTSFVHKKMVPSTLAFALCVMPTYATYMGASIIFWRENTKMGLNWGQLFEKAIPELDVSLGAVMCMLFGDVALFGILTWYIEAVCPGKLGVAKSKLFFLKLSYWKPTKKNVTELQIDGVEEPIDTEDISTIYFEAEPTNLYKSVALVELTKVFNKTTTSVDKLSLNFYRDQITGFLGLNGAGKSTTISMLTGSLSPTSGTAFINGYDIRYDLDKARQDIGLCPQKDTLYPELTVVEHLKFYGRLKEIEESELDGEIDSMMRAIKMTPWANRQAKDLSGGMCRRLCIAIASIGRSSIIFLDEPTATVDPASRRSIWHMLEQLRSGRTLVLTTHRYLDADAICDRIAFISEGQLKCCGTSSFLKARFREGYFVTISFQKIPSNKKKLSREIEEYAKERVEDAALVPTIGNNIRISLPHREDINSIFKLISDLENDKDEFGIESIGISDTSLEQVCLNMTRRYEISDPDQSSADVRETIWKREERMYAGIRLRQPTLKFSVQLMIYQFKALFYKRLFQLIGHQKYTLLVILFPTILVIIAMALNDIGDFFHYDGGKNQTEIGSVLLNGEFAPTASRELEYYKYMSKISPIVLMICVAATTPTISPTFFLNEDKQNDLKHFQLMSGLRIYIYWIQNFLSDFLVYLVPFTLIIIVCSLFRNDSLMGQDNRAAFLILLLINGWSNIPASYCFHKIFGIEFAGLICVHIILGSFMAIITVLTKDSAYRVEIFLLLYPPFSFEYGIKELIANRNFGDRRTLGNGTDRDMRSSALTGVCKYYIMIMFLSGAFYLLLVIAIDYTMNYCIRLKVLIEKWSRPYLNIRPIYPDDDVLDEERRIRSFRTTSDDIVIFRNVTKIFRGFRAAAINHVSFGVPRGQCFGVVGANGSGKSTLFKLVLGEIPLSSGEAFVMGLDVHSHVKTIRRNCGYCPESDSLYNVLTVYQHLMFFAKLRGIHHKEQDEVVRHVMDELKLTKVSHEYAGNLSEGARRKLLAAMSLLGNPSVIFMDEPTKSMDPKSRRVVWNAIQRRVAAGCTILIASQNIEECENLCSLMTILVDGRPVCFGSVQHLKYRFGEGYTLAMSVPPGINAQRNLADIQELVDAEMPDSMVIASYPSRIVFRVPRNINVSTIFSTVRKALKSRRLADYSVSQSSLEDVFMKFANHEST